MLNIIRKTSLFTLTNWHSTNALYLSGFSNFLLTLRRNTYFGFSCGYFKTKVVYLLKKEYKVMMTIYWNTCYTCTDIYRQTLRLTETFCVLMALRKFICWQRYFSKLLVAASFPLTESRTCSNFWYNNISKGTCITSCIFSFVDVEFCYQYEALAYMSEIAICIRLNNSFRIWSVGIIYFI